MDLPINPDGLLARTYRLLDATNLTYAQLAEGAGVERHWVEKFKQRKISTGAGVDKVQRVHDYLTAYEAIRSPEVQAQIASCAVPNPSQDLANAGTAHV